MAILEIVKPRQGSIMSRLFPFYFRQITPRLGSWFAGDEQAYTYLPESVQAFMTSEEIVSEIVRHGLVGAKVMSLAFGTVVVVSGTKPLG